MVNHPTPNKSYVHLNKMSDAMESANNQGNEASSVVIVSLPGSTTENQGGTTDKKEHISSGSPDPACETGDRKKEEKEEEKIMTGAVSESKDLYAKYDKDGDRSWSETLPDGLEDAAESDKTLKYAVLVRKKKPKEADSTKSLVIDSIIVQSPFLKHALANVFEGYPSLATNVSRLVFSAPFECFVHRWDRFSAAKDESQYDEITKEHLQLLRHIMASELGEIITLRQDYLNNKVVTWNHAWTLFPPGCTVIGSKRGKPVAVRFNRGNYARTQCGKVYVMECQIIDWDGEKLGWTDCNQQIQEYGGSRPFTGLPCYPLQFHNQADADALGAMLIDRGRKWESLIGYHYKYYDGLATYHPAEDPDRICVEKVASRVVIDSTTWECENYRNRNHIESLHKYERPLQTRRGSVCSDDSNSSDDSSDERDVKVENNGHRVPLKDEHLLMTVPVVRGYSLKSKRWMEFYVDNIAEIEFDTSSFSSLVLEDDHKELILAFAQSQVKHKHSFDDIISGKGKGIIMLLSGGPGIGKTLTAESVAEEMQVPLYILSAGDIGTNEYSAERSLNRVMRMVANWNAVLLLDECDIFLEERSPNDMKRNRVVGIFLRMLEYYEGILFLTTNRVKCMDPAFQSRIHISLEYPNLDSEARAAIWRMFLARTDSLETVNGGGKAHKVTEEDVSLVSKLNLNGRQIKNVLKMANLLACQKGAKLSFEHIKKVLKVQGNSL